MYNPDHVTNANVHENDFSIELYVAGEMGMIAWTDKPHCRKFNDQLPYNMHGLYISRARGGCNLISFWENVARIKQRP